MYRLYLAGPDVFLPEPLAAGKAKKALCALYGFEGVYPLDAVLDLDGLAGPQAAQRIALANEAAMRSCHAAIANMTPFRGPGMDGGTAYEMGFMRALGRPVFGYTTHPDLFADRTRQFCAGPVRQRQDGYFEDVDGLLIEDFGLADNLMMAIAANESGIPIAVGDGPLRDTGPFEDCLRMAQRVLSGKPFTNA